MGRRLCHNFIQGDGSWQTSRRSAGLYGWGKGTSRAMVVEEGLLREGPGQRLGCVLVSRNVRTS